MTFEPEPTVPVQWTDQKPTMKEAREIEARLCSCGVSMMLGGESWAIQHAEKCPARGVIRQAIIAGAR